MTEIALRTEPTAELAPVGTVASLVGWADEVAAAHQLATKLVVTSFVPDYFKGKPHEAAAAILTGHELGLSPLASLRSIHVIKGTPGMYAKAMVAVVMKAGHDVWVEEQSDERVVVCGRRAGTDHIARTVWDRARAVQAKLLSNSKYNETPQQMYTARGQAEICRQIAPDALLGIPYAVEEVRTLPDRQEPAEDGRVTAAEILDAEAEEDWPATTQPPVFAEGGAA